MCRARRSGRSQPTQVDKIPFDRQQAEKYVEVLFGSKDAVVTFQTFWDDKTKEKQQPHPGWLHGTLSQHWETLAVRNEAGHGIFVMMNEGDGKGRSGPNVVAARYIFTDDDESVCRAYDQGALPTMVTRSARGPHSYWKLQKGEPLAEFTQTQKHLANYFKTDPAVSDVARVMRVAGFFHMKNPANPVLVEIVEAHPERQYTMEDLRNVYVVAEPESVPKKKNSSSVEHARAFIETQPPAIQGKGGDAHTFSICCTVVRGFDIEDDDDALIALADWNKRCEPPWAENDLRRKVADARVKGQEPLGGRLGGKTDDNPFTGFGERKMVQHCVPVLNKRFVLLRLADGSERLFSVNDKREVALLQNDTLLVQALHDRLKTTFGRLPPKGLLTSAIGLWMRETKVITEEPEPFCFKADHRLCFRYFDWEPMAGEYGAWKEFLDRLSDPGAFMAFVWSCFEKDNRSRQYLWLRGNGQDGKSSILGVLQEVFGPASASLNNAHIKSQSQFLGSLVYGKRLVTYPDCKNQRFGMSEFVRSLTSGDQVPIEFKHKTPFTARLYAKLFVASNAPPQIGGEKADQSRMIFIEVAASKSTDDPTWTTRLRTELPAFLWACKVAYAERCPKGGDISISDKSEALKAKIAVEFEERFHDVFEERFIADPNCATEAKFVSAALRAEGLNNNEIADFKAWMARMHGVVFKPTNKVRLYRGLRLNTDHPDAVLTAAALDAANEK